MKSFRRSLSLGAAFALASVAVAVWLVNRGPTTPCGGDWPASGGHVILASKVVARPWYGRHNVYGIFVLPRAYADSSRYSAAIEVRGVGDAGVVDERPMAAHEDDVPIGPGEYRLQALLQTRTALRFLVTGRFGDLRNPCNWALVLVDRSRG